MDCDKTMLDDISIEKLIKSPALTRLQRISVKGCILITINSLIKFVKTQTNIYCGFDFNFFIYNFSHLINDEFIINLAKNKAFI